MSLIIHTIIGESSQPSLTKKTHVKNRCESHVKLEQDFTCDPHVVKSHVEHMSFYNG